MPSRIVKVELPALDRLSYPSFALTANPLGWNIVNFLVAMAKEEEKQGNHDTGAYLREAAKLLDALRIALQKDDYDIPEPEQDKLTPGELAISRELRLIRYMLADEIRKLTERRDEAKPKIQLSL